jgi:hypothetical protein
VLLTPTTPLSCSLAIDLIFQKSNGNEPGKRKKKLQGLKMREVGTNWSSPSRRNHPKIHCRPCWCTLCVRFIGSNRPQNQKKQKENPLFCAQKLSRSQRTWHFNVPAYFSTPKSVIQTRGRTPAAGSLFPTVSTAKRKKGAV